MTACLRANPPVCLCPPACLPLPARPPPPPLPPSHPGGAFGSVVLPCLPPPPHPLCLSHRPLWQACGQAGTHAPSAHVSYRVRFPMRWAGLYRMAHWVMPSEIYGPHPHEPQARA